MSKSTRHDDAWLENMKKRDWAHLPESERRAQIKRGKEKVRQWKAGRVQKKTKNASCTACKKTTLEAGNPVLICDDCDKGALHFLCTTQQLEAIPDILDEWSCDKCFKKRVEFVQTQPTTTDSRGSTRPQPQSTSVEQPTESTQQERQPMDVDGSMSRAPVSTVPVSTQPQPQPQPMNVDGPTESTQQQQPGGVGGPMKRTPVSTVARESTATKRKPRTAAKGKAKSSKAKAGSTARKSRKRRVRRPARVIAKEYARILESCLDDDELREFVGRSRASAIEKAGHFKDSFHRAGKEPSDSITSIPLIAKLLTPGLCDDPLDGIEIVDGVFFRRSALDGLERYFNWEYVFDPKSIGVVSGETRVSVDDEEFVVISFDHGEYILSDGSTMKQWALLEHRIGEGVTLEAELRRFIIHLVVTYVNMMAKGVPAVIKESNPNMVKDMLWNPSEARKRETKEERKEELDRIIKRADSLRDLTLRIFTKATVKDTLPDGFWDVRGNQELREFAEEPGSLKKMNFMDRLECVGNREVTTGKLFTGDIVTGGYSEAPQPKRVSGAWHAKLRSIIVQLTCVYRLGRSDNLLEAYYALSDEEIEIVQRHHSHWDDNLKYGLRNLDLSASEVTSATDANLQGDNSHALRFAVKRCRKFKPYIAPVTVVGCGIRDAETYGSLQWDSLDTKYFSHARIGEKLVPPLMGNAPCREPTKWALQESAKLFETTRRGRDKAAAEKNGGLGPSVKVRKQRVPLIDLTPEEREEVLDRLMALIKKNGCGRLMTAIKNHDPGFVEWGKERLAKAELKSSRYSSRDDYVKPDDGGSEDHLVGNTPGEIEYGQQRVASLIAKLEVGGAFKPKDISIFSVGLALACLLTGACLRPQDFFRKAREFRHASSEKVCRLLGGDLSLVPEIEARHASLQASEEGRSTQAFMLSGSPPGEEHAITENFDGMPAGFRYLHESDRADYAKRLLEQQLENQRQSTELKLMESNVELKRKRCDNLLQTYKTMQADLGVKLDDRTLIEIRDNISIISRQDLSQAVNVNGALAVATPLLTDSQTPTHELDALQRGQETGIVPVSAKIGVRVPKNLSGTVGKRLKQLYISKYSLEPEWKGFIKRQTLFQGRPILENVYYERDEDIVEQAIRDVVPGN